VPVVWNAVGVIAGMPTWAGSLVRAAAQCCDLVAVRDEHSANQLAPFAEHIRVVPDTAVGMRCLVDADGARDVLRSIGVGGPYVVVEPGPAGDALARAATSTPTLLGGRQVVVVAAGPVFGEQRDSAMSLPGAVALDPWPWPPVLAGVLSGADGVVATSLHFSLVAAAAGVPVVPFTDLFEHKWAVLAGMEGVHGGDVDARDFPALLGRGAVPRWVEAADAALADHWDAVVATMGRRPSTPVARAALADLLAALPRALRARDAAESGHGDESARVAELEAREAASAEAQAWLVARREELDQLEQSLRPSPVDHARVAELEHLLDLARIEIQHRDARLAAMEASTSWRVTAPLRAASDVVRRRRR
jgi:hypothetical protein